MSDDLLRRLRCPPFGTETSERNLMDAAATEITHLCARVAELEGALREMVYETTHLSPQKEDGSHWCKISKHTLEKARAALEGKKDE